MIGASNFFELAVAAESEVALATAMGVLLEVPVMLFLARVVNSSTGWYEAGLR